MEQSYAESKKLLQVQIGIVWNLELTTWAVIGYHPRTSFHLVENEIKSALGETIFY